MTKPITPDEIVDIDLPDFVIEAFNELLNKNYRNGEAKIYQYDALEGVKRKAKSSAAYNLIDNAVIFRNNWLDVESTFEKFGWNVKYYKPPYWSQDQCYFIFSK